MRLERKGETAATRGLVELHTDGSGAHALAPNYASGNGEAHFVVVREQILGGIALGLQRLGEHAELSAGASGLAAVRCTVLPPNRHLSTNGRGTPMALRNIDPDWDYDLEQTTPISGRLQTSLEGIGIDELARPGQPLMTVATRLSDQIANIFGEPDLGLITPNGDLAPTVDLEWAAGFREWLT